MADDDRSTKDSDAATEVRRTLDTLFGDGEVFELRVFECPPPNGRGRAMTAAGWYDRHEVATPHVVAYERRKPPGIYCTVNPIKPDLLARAENRMGDYARDLTLDKHVLRRKWLLLDVDPERIPGISATDAEKAAAESAAARLRDWLADEHGWPDPIEADSGNGRHLLYRIDLPNDAESTALVESVLKGAAAALAGWDLDGPPVKVDTSVFNAARITKVYGTWARKGDHTRDRPHRRSGLVTAPATTLTVTPECLESVAALAPEPETPSRQAPPSGGSQNGEYKSRLDVAKWLQARGVGFRRKEKPDGKGRTVFVLDVCPFNPDHGVDTCVVQAPDGQLGFKCLHDGCSGRGWQDVKSAIGKPDGDHYDPPLEGKKKRKTKAPKAAPPPQDDGRPAVIVNADVVGSGEDAEVVPRHIDVIATDVSQLFGDDGPYRVSTALFVRAGEEVKWLEKPTDLFAAIGRRSVIPPIIREGTGLHGRTDIHAHFRANAFAYDGVEEYPHEPPCPNLFYACSVPEPGDGTRLRELLSRFNPETEIDADLILAFFMTVLWGGPGGSRPAFLVTSRDGRGAGKSTLAKMIGHTFGGLLEISPSEDIDRIKKRLLSPEGMTKRVVSIDNVKSPKFSWADLEGLVTAAHVSGYRNYVGEGRRANVLTYAITLNGAALSTDLAQRSVIINVRRPVYSGDWEDDTRTFIETHRDEIIGDLIAALREERTRLPKHSRWGLWEREVLERLPDPSEAQAVILERQAAANVEEEEAEIVSDYFARQLRELDYDPDVDRIFIPNETAAVWFNKATNNNYTTAKVTRALKQTGDESTGFPLAESPSRRNGRGFVWTGAEASPSDPMKTDLIGRQSAVTRGWR